MDLCYSTKDVPFFSTDDDVEKIEEFKELLKDYPKSNYEKS